MILVQILASYWKSLLAIAGASFAALALAIIFLLPGPQVLVRSSIDIGSYFLRGDALAIYPPDALARRTLNVYVPLTLSAMSKEGTPTRILSALRSSTVEASPLSIVIVTTVEASAEDAARKFQEGVATLILDGEKPRAEALREAQAAKAAAASSNNNYDKQISTDKEQIDRINRRIEEIENNRRDQTAELARLLQQQQSAGHADEQSSVQTRIRQLQDRLTDQAAALTTLSIQQNGFLLDLGATEKLVERLTDTAAESQLDKKAFSEPRVSLPPTAALVTPQWRRGGMLVVALIASLLFAFGAVTTIYNTQAINRQS